MITIEATRRVISHFGLGFTNDYVLRQIQSKGLERVPKPYNGVRDSSYGYGVSIDSVVKLLLSHGITEKEIIEVLPA